MPTFNSDLKKLYLRLRKEIYSREQYCISKNEKWQESEQADIYTVKTQILREAYDNLTTTIVDLGIKIK